MGMQAVSSPGCNHVFIEEIFYIFVKLFSHLSAALEVQGGDWRFSPYPSVCPSFHQPSLGHIFFTIKLGITKFGMQEVFYLHHTYFTRQWKMSIVFAFYKIYFNFFLFCVDFEDQLEPF